MPSIASPTRMKRLREWLSDSSPLGPLYHPLWRRRIATILVVSLVLPICVLIAGIAASGGQATAGSIAIGAAAVYLVQLAVTIPLAIRLMPPEMKREWRFRQFKRRARLSKNNPD